MIYPFLTCIAMQNIASATKFYTIGGFAMYFSNRDTLRTKHEWNSKVFDDFLKAQPAKNQQFDEAYNRDVTTHLN